jgi:hypothetical protein
MLKALIAYVVDKPIAQMFLDNNLLASIPALL